MPRIIRSSQQTSPTFASAINNTTCILLQIASESPRRLAHLHLNQILDKAKHLASLGIRVRSSHTTLRHLSTLSTSLHKQAQNLLSRWYLGLEKIFRLPTAQFSYRNHACFEIRVLFIFAVLHPRLTLEARPSSETAIILLKTLEANLNRVRWSTRDRLQRHLLPTCLNLVKHLFLNRLSFEHNLRRNQYSFSQRLDLSTTVSRVCPAFSNMLPLLMILTCSTTTSPSFQRCYAKSSRPSYASSTSVVSTVGRCASTTV